MNKKIISICILASLLISCQSDSLSENSVIIPSKKLSSEIDKWIKDSLVIPYGIDVKYHWDKYSSINRVQSPPKLENILPLLVIVKQLWIDLYNDSRIGGRNFIKNTAPREIYLYSQRNMIKNKLDTEVEIIATEESPIRMSIYNVDNFNPSNKESVIKLLRVLHHNFAKTLANNRMFDQKQFFKLNPYGYIDWEQEITYASDIDPYTIDFLPANRRGFYTLPARKSLLDDFAETVSIMFTYSRTDMNKRIEKARKIPLGDDDPKEVEYSINSEKALTEKREFVIKYFNDFWGINLVRAQTISLIKINNINK